MSQMTREHPSSPVSQAQGRTVQTARGPVEVSGLGQVLMHEHVFVLTAEV